MKKFYLFIPALLLLTGCSKAADVPEQPQSNSVSASEALVCSTTALN